MKTKKKVMKKKENQSGTTIKDCHFETKIWDAQAIEAVNLTAKALLNMTELFKAQNIHVTALQINPNQPPKPLKKNTIMERCKGKIDDNGYCDVCKYPADKINVFKCGRLKSSPPQTAEAEEILHKTMSDKYVFCPVNDELLPYVFKAMEEYAQIKSLEARNKALQEAIDTVTGMVDVHRGIRNNYTDVKDIAFKNVISELEKLKKPL